MSRNRKKTQLCPENFRNTDTFEVIREEAVVQNVSETLPFFGPGLLGNFDESGRASRQVRKGAPLLHWERSEMQTCTFRAQSCSSNIRKEARQLSLHFGSD